MDLKDSKWVVVAFVIAPITPVIILSIYAFGTGSLTQSGPMLLLAIFVSYFGTIVFGILAYFVLESKKVRAYHHYFLAGLILTLLFSLLPLWISLNSHFSSNYLDVGFADVSSDVALIFFTSFWAIQSTILVFWILVRRSRA